MKLRSLGLGWLAAWGDSESGAGGVSGAGGEHGGWGV
ncbi:MAG: hypothetical protein RI897_1474 [Verrucomicrobiota bacterium]|jgi:hypothetical protein